MNRTRTLVVSALLLSSFVAGCIVRARPAPVVVARPAVVVARPAPVVVAQPTTTVYVR